MIYLIYLIFSGLGQLCHVKLLQKFFFASFDIWWDNDRCWEVWEVIIPFFPLCAKNGSKWDPIEIWLKYKSVSCLLGTCLDTQIFKIGPLSQKLRRMTISFLSCSSMLGELWGLFFVDFWKMNFDDDRCLHETDGVPKEVKWRSEKIAEMNLGFLKMEKI